MDERGSDKKSRSELLAKLRKERSAEAARARRNKENGEYDNIKKLLPIDETIAKNLDKASVIRITISFLRMCKFAESGSKHWDIPIDQGKASLQYQDEGLSKKWP